ncbi:ankyrin [Anaeromyces robustus]|uniref:Ankyrin n=1 Tax=Anaeromyces robustus TaxID=1754192 RepID=A0A1Y1WA37_9FUNG|nr:ankyrin [Anaeromyces robustus]|eukprot:ORX70391.1 ankyrin [Anaeromyces robustus]
MLYEKFEAKLITQLVKDKKKVIDTIERNKPLIENNLTSSGNLERTIGFVEKLIYIIIEELKNFKLVEKVLKHELFIDVLTVFRESTVLIQAIKKKNINAIEWLFTIDVNIFVRDAKGMTALMHAAECSLLDVIKKLLKRNINLIYINDNNDENILFYALTDETIFEYIYNLNKIDIHHINGKNENLLISSCRHKKFKYFNKILKLTNNLNHINNEGKTAAIYLIENGRYDELYTLLSKCTDSDTIRIFSKVYMTTLINQFRQIYSNGKLGLVDKYVKTMIVLNVYKYNFNVPIDEEGNTPFMYFMMVGDLCSCCYLLEKCKNLNLSIKNKKGISVSYLSLFIDHSESVFLKHLTEHKTFDYSYVDSNNYSLLMHYIVRNRYSDAKTTAFKSKRTLNHVNDKNESAVTIATKLGRLQELYITPENINHQDNLGNTALAYAIKLRDETLINLLLYYHSNPYIRNNQGISPLDLVKGINEKKFFDIIKHPLSPEEMKEKIKENRKGFLFFDRRKTEEEKTNELIKNSQINEFNKEYQDLLKPMNYTYSEMTKKNEFDEILTNIYMDIYSMNAPKRLLKEREDRKSDSRRRRKNRISRHYGISTVDTTEDLRMIVKII